MGYHLSAVPKHWMKMLAKTGLLVVSNPKQIGNLLVTVRKEVNHTLYIQFLSALSDPLGNFNPKTFKTWAKFSPTIFGVYSQASTHCNGIDVRVLLSGLKYNIPKIQTQRPVDLIIFDKPYSSSEIDCFVNNRLQNLSKDYNVITLNSENFNDEVIETPFDNKKYNHSVLGGTFDRLHLAHKLLLSEAALRAHKKVTVGVTDENMLQSKILCELIEPINVRINGVRDFLTDICPELEYKIVPIEDPFGPSIIDPTMELIVVSEETIKGGKKINSIREERNLPSLDILPVELVDEPNANSYEEKKISSSTRRMRLLGTVLKPLRISNDIPKTPYVIGLTGSIASGKSGVAKHLQDLGAQVINCDLIAHEVYQAGKPCFEEIVENFGRRVVGDTGEIDRKTLGSIVFQNKQDLEKLNHIVWPHIAYEVQNKIKESLEKVIVIEAAVLLLAGWQNLCHEVWTTVIPKEEAIKRLVERNGLNEEQANSRINAQPCNKYYVDNANVVFCTLWPVEYTKEQVVKAWDLLLKRMP